MNGATAATRAAEIIATSRIKLSPEIVAITAAGKGCSQEEYNAALAIALAAGDWKPKPPCDAAHWQSVPGGAIKRGGNLIHLKLARDVAPWTGPDHGYGPDAIAGADFNTLITHDTTETFDLAAEPGLLGDIARWSQTYAFRPVREFAQPAALAVLSALFGRRWATPTGLGLNLYQVAIAETGGGKDALAAIAKAVILSRIEAAALAA